VRNITGHSPLKLLDEIHLVDFNSAVNIKNRVLLDVLKDKLLTINNFSEFSNKNLKKEIIKSTLENYYRVA